MARDNTLKQCIIPINNKDELCCARAIVTMRAWCHRNDPGAMGRSNWSALRQGRPRQTVQARELHQAAGVPEGPCGLEQLAAFQRVLSPQYQLKVMCRSKPFFILFRGPDAPHQILLIKSDSHYDGCTSFSAFVNKSYWCHHCDRGFNDRAFAKHACEGRICRACARDIRHPCPDYEKNRSPDTYCTECNRRFYGPRCFQYHRDAGQCQSWKTCRSCQATYQVKKGKRHRCGYAKCHSCQETVDMTQHRCYIQPSRNEEEAPSEEDDDPPPPPPQFVYADIEAMQTADRGFTANLLCYRHQDQRDIVTLKGEDCCERFMQHLDDLAHPIDRDVEEEDLIILFHNLKGFDGLFILRQLYQEQRQVENQLTVGAKVLSFQSGPLTFKDSLCFLPMPLSAFPATFGLLELKKGYFPHKFNRLENQSYVGPIPDLSHFDPDGFSSKGKAALQTWHAEQVRRGVVYDFAKELEEYCQFDVDILQRGCEAFCEEFESHTGFNSFAKCVTIASACNLYWRKFHLPADTIAVQPPSGWRGANVNHSLQALQWLYYQESLIPKEGAAADRIRHVRNGGEVSLRLDGNMTFVDGYDATTRTFYEFHGCLWHGCPTCCSPNMWSTRTEPSPNSTLPPNTKPIAFDKRVIA